MKTLGIFLMTLTCLLTIGYADAQAACGLLDQDCCVSPRGNKICTVPGLECRDNKCKTPPPPCGGPDQNCCGNNVCATPGYECREGKCRVICGGIDQPCCPGPVKCLRPDAACENNKCVKRCGEANQVCCDGTQCNSGNNCVAGKCLSCGKVGLPCCQSGNKCETGYLCDLAGLICAQCGGLGQVCCPPEVSAARCSGTNLTCTAGRCAAVPQHGNTGGTPDLKIWEVKGTGADYGRVAVTVKNIGNGPTTSRCSVFAATYMYNPKNSSPNKWEPVAGCFQQQYEFGILAAGQSATVSTCGYPPDKVPTGFWQVYTVANRCGGEENESNNQYSVRKEPDQRYIDSFYGPGR